MLVLKKLGMWEWLSAVLKVAVPVLKEPAL
jgi:hypothetical protein